MEMSHEHLPAIHLQGHTNTEPSKPSHRAIKNMNKYPKKTRPREYDIQGRTNTELSKPSNRALKTKDTYAKTCARITSGRRSISKSRSKQLQPA